MGAIRSPGRATRSPVNGVGEQGFGRLVSKHIFLCSCRVKPEVSSGPGIRIQTISRIMLVPWSSIACIIVIQSRRSNCIPSSASFYPKYSSSLQHKTLAKFSPQRFCDVGTTPTFLFQRFSKKSLEEIEVRQARTDQDSGFPFRGPVLGSPDDWRPPGRAGRRNLFDETARPAHAILDLSPDVG